MKKLLFTKYVLLFTLLWCVCSFLFTPMPYAQQCSEDTQLARLTPAMVGGGVPAAGGGAVTIVSGQYDSSVINGANQATITCTLTNDVGVGNTIIVGVAVVNNTATAIASIADSGSNTYQQIVGNGRTVTGNDLWYANNVAQKGSGTFEIVVTFGSGLGDYPTVFCVELTGVDDTNPIDDFDSADMNSVTTHTAGTVTATAGGAVVATLVRSDSSNYVTDPVDGYTELYALDNGATYNPASFMVKENASAGNYTPTWTTASATYSANVCAALKAK